VGTVIGSGIFLVPGPIAHELIPLSSVLLVWIVGGVLSLCGALSLGELAALYPGAGGLYVYLQRAYGRPLSFLYGWGLFSVIQSGTIATLSTAFALYLASIVPLSPTMQKIVAILCIVVFSAINYLGVKPAKLVQNLSTVSKLIGLAALVGLLFWRGNAAFLHRNLQFDHIASPSMLSYGLALVAVLWAYEGWHVVSFVASEFRSPQRDLPRSLAWGIFFCAGIYLLTNMAYYSVLSPQSLSDSNRAAATAVFTAYGSSATVFISVLIMISVLGSTNGSVMTGARVYYAMAKDGLFFQQCATVHPRFRTPGLAIVAQGIWASLLTLTGTFQQLFTYVVFTAWIFYALAVGAVIVLRIRKPELNRSFRVPAYPWLQIVFILAAISIALSTIYNDPLRSAAGMGIILLGIPIYAVFSRKLPSEANSSASADLSSDLYEN
jgi:APA family basic amino acid/polyamine antiporter